MISVGEEPKKKSTFGKIKYFKIYLALRISMFMGNSSNSIQLIIFIITCEH